MPTGSWILVPPAHLAENLYVRWLVTPEFVGGTVASFTMMRDVLTFVVKNRAIQSAG
jgi:hypothetical protein